MAQYSANSMLIALFVRLSFSFNPGVSFFALVDMQYGMGIFSDFINSISSMYSGYISGTNMGLNILHAILTFVEAIPLWLVNCVIMTGITVAAVFLSAMFIKPVRGGGEKKRG